MEGASFDDYINGRLYRGHMSDDSDITLANGISDPHDRAIFEYLFLNRKFGLSCSWPPENEVMRRIIAYPCYNPAFNDNYAVRWAASTPFVWVNKKKHNQEYILDRLLADVRVDPSVDDNVAINIAAHMGYTSVVAKLLAHPRIGHDLDTALWRAAYRGHAEIVKMLLEDGRANPAAYNNKALDLALTIGNVECITLLLDDGRADPTFKKFFLKAAILSGKVDAVHLLIYDNRVRRVLKNEDLDEGICLAQRKGYFDIADLLAMASDNK